MLHYVGAGVAFPTSVLFVSVQSALTYKLAKTQGEYNMGHLRLIMTLLAFVTLVLSILFSDGYLYNYMTNVIHYIGKVCGHLTDHTYVSVNINYKVL